jgi:hypothetical protein
VINWKSLIDLESNAFLYVLFLAIIFGPAFGFSDVYDHMTNVDVQTYVGLSEFDFDQHPVRRYRIIIPMLAAGVYFIFEPILSILTPQEYPGDFPRIMSFVLVNIAMMSLYALILFRLSEAVLGKSKFWPIIIGVVSVLTCRWTMLFAGSALVDSLYLVVIGLLLLGILKKEIWMVILAIYLGPWAKEAFIFFVPLLLFIDKKYYLKLGLHLLISGIIIFSFRYCFDQLIGADFGESFNRDVSHFAMIPESLKRLFSFHGLYEIFSIGGFWNLIILGGFCVKSIRSRIKENITLLWIIWSLIVLVQALLSHELARMFYLLTPLLAIVVALVFDSLINRKSRTI